MYISKYSNTFGHCCYFTSTVNNYGHVDLAILFMGRLGLHMQLTSTKVAVLTIQKWQNSARESSKLSLYCQIKTTMTLNLILKFNKFRNAYACLRLFCHDLEIESGRYARQTREMRVCKWCRNLVEDEQGSH